MKGRDIVVIGASAGGIAALRQLASVLPAGLRATVIRAALTAADVAGDAARTPRRSASRRRRPARRRASGKM